VVGTPAPPAPTVSQRRQQFVTTLDLARADVTSGAYAQAQTRAETVLRDGPPPDIRSTALAVAGDAAYGMGAYRTAAERYGQILLSDEVTAEAPHATLALGWAELRLGRRQDACRTWIRLARQFPTDPRASLSQILCAELSAQTGETVVARKLFDRALEAHPTGPDADLARLGRSVLAMREGRTADGVRDLRVLAGSTHLSAPAERKKILDGLSGATTAPDRRLFLTNHYESRLTARPDQRGSGENGATATNGTAPATSSVLERLAAPFLDGAGDAETTPRVLHGLVVMATEDKAWPEVQTLQTSLVGYSPGYAPATALLAWVGDRAVSEQQWTVARASYQQAFARNGTPLAAPARINYAEALYRTGEANQARVELTRAMETAPSPEEAPRALYLLADVNETLERRQEALAAYERVRRDYPRAVWTGERRLRHARLVQESPGRHREAQALFEEIVQFTEGDTYTEASFRLAQTLAADGQHTQAVDWFMAAAYGSPDRSPWYRPALLGAGRSLMALKRPQAAVAVYRSLLSEASVEPPATNGQAEPVTAESRRESDLAAEAAYGVAEIARGSGRHEEAVEMYLTAAYLAPESPWAPRALLGAVRSQVALGDRASAETSYRRLVEWGGHEPELVEQARRTLRSGGKTSRSSR
jgi:TolA-binding protein